MLRIVSRGFSLAGLSGALLIAQAPVARSQEPKTPVAPSTHVGSAELVKTYKENCADCHGDNGTGNRTRKRMPGIPDFTSLAWQMSQTDLEIAHRILDGHEPTMPAYRDEISRPQVLALSVYVRAFSINASIPSPAGPSARMSSVNLYRAYCLACHDAGGRGATIRKAMPEIPDFADAKWQSSRTDAEIRHSILEGKGKFMLPMKDKLGLADAGRMVSFLRGFRDGEQAVELEPEKPAPAAAVVAVPIPASPVPAAAAAPRSRSRSRSNLGVVTRVYRQYCLTCHGVDGKGAEMRPGMPTLPDFTGKTWHESKTDEQLTVSVLDGKGGLMPSFRDRVNPDQAREVVAYVRSFGPAHAEPVAAAPSSEFESRLQQLQQQWDAVEKQMKALSAKPRVP